MLNHPLSYLQTPHQNIEQLQELVATLLTHDLRKPLQELFQKTSGRFTVIYDLEKSGYAIEQILIHTNPDISLGELYDFHAHTRVDKELVSLRLKENELEVIVCDIIKRDHTDFMVEYRRAIINLDKVEPVIFKISYFGIESVLRSE